MIPVSLTKIIPNCRHLDRPIINLQLAVAYLGLHFDFGWGGGVQIIFRKVGAFAIGPVRGMLPRIFF